jgi:hypothetical protein
MGVWLLPRESSSLFTLPRPTLANLFTTPTLLCRANSDRIVLIFAPDRAQQFTVWWGTQTMVSGRFILTTADPLLQFLHSESGPLCQQEWWGTGPGIGGFLSVQEVLLERAPK